MTRMETTTQSSSAKTNGAEPATLGTGSEAGGRSRGGWLGAIIRSPWALVCLGLLVVGTALAFWARTSPGYDPYGWLVWGYQAVRLNLDLAGAPSWKPMPLFFTLPYAVFGHYEFRLWIVTAVTVSLGGFVVAGHITYRLLREGSEDRWPAIAGAAFTIATMLGIVQYFHYILSAQSDSMLTTFVLLAIDLHLSRRYRWAYAFLVGASLGRPEAWPILGLYALWCWFRVPRMRAYVAAGIVVVGFMWFGFPLLSHNSPLTSANLAEHSPRRLRGNKITGTLTRFHDLSYWPVFAAAAVGIVLAALRRNWMVLIIGGGAALWVLVEIAFALHGYPAVPRYLFEAIAATIVVAGVGFGWMLQAAAGGLRRGAAAAARMTAAGATLAVAVLVGFLVPDAIAGIRWERHDLVHERARTTEINRLPAAIKAFGGIDHLLSCGRPSVTVEYASILAWYTHLNVGRVGFEEIRDKYVLRSPTAWFTPTSNGWIVRIYHMDPAKRATCANLVNAFYLTTPAHPGGILLNSRLR